MNAHEETMTLQELRRTAKELRAIANADPANRAAGLLEYAVSQMVKVDAVVERIAGLERREATIDASLKNKEERDEQLSRDIQSKEGQVESLDQKIDHLKRVLSDVQTQVQLERNLHV